jgi:flagellar hook-associated protein FlgK
MNIFTSPTMTSGNALQHALTGMSRSKDQFHSSAIETVQSFADQSNALSNGDTALSSEAFISAVATSPETSIVNMIQAQHAFEANLKVFQSVAETEAKVLDIIT